MAVTLNSIASPQTFTVSLGGTPEQKLYSCTGIATFDYTGNPNWDSLTVGLVNDAGNPLIIPSNETLQDSTATASLNSLSGSGSVLWAADSLSLEMDVNTRRLFLVVSLATNTSCHLMRIAYQVLFVTATK